MDASTNLSINNTIKNASNTDSVASDTETRNAAILRKFQQLQQRYNERSVPSGSVLRSRSTRRRSNGNGFGLEDFRSAYQSTSSLELFLCGLILFTFVLPFVLIAYVPPFNHHDNVRRHDRRYNFDHYDFNKHEKEIADISERIRKTADGGETLSKMMMANRVQLSVPLNNITTLLEKAGVSKEELRELQRKQQHHTHHHGVGTGPHEQPQPQPQPQPHHASSSHHHVPQQHHHHDHYSDRIPPTSDVRDLYGPGPVLYNSRSCENFRAAVPPSRRYIAPAGMFNTGTNLLSTLLRRNCRLPNPNPDDHVKNGMLFQVPWGKHNPSDFRLHNVAADGGEGVVQEDVLPVVVVKDPVAWIDSMCRHQYGVVFHHHDDRNRDPHHRQQNNECPDLAGEGGAMTVTVPYPGRPRNYDSLLHLWNEWYEEWTVGNDAPYFLVVRYEDLLFHAERTVTEICKCGGGTMNTESKDANVPKTFLYNPDSAKGEVGGHKGGSSLVSAVQRYGSMEWRERVLHAEDAEFVRRNVDRNLLETFSYRTL